MKKIDSNQFTQFTGTAKYYRISRRHLLTDGTKYLAEAAECFWMMDAIASHLCEIGTEDWFVSVRVQVTEGTCNNSSVFSPRFWQRPPARRCRPAGAAVWAERKIPPRSRGCLRRKRLESIAVFESREFLMPVVQPVQPECCPDKLFYVRARFGSRKKSGVFEGQQWRISWQAMF